MPTFNVVVTDHEFSNLDIERGILAAADCEVIDACCKTPEDVIAAAADADGLINGGVILDAKVIAALQRCKFIVRYGVGVDSIDLAAATAKGIAVCNIPDASTDEVADHTLALTLALARRLPLMDRWVRDENWGLAEGFRLPALEELTFATLGFGRIARAALERARPFKFRLAAYDPFCNQEDIERNGITALTLDELFARADILSLHAPLTAGTHHIVDAARFAQMKDGAILINAGRGGLVDTEALLGSLKSGKLAYAGLDVFEEEPLPKTHPLCAMDNVLLSPHLASLSDISLPRFQRLAAEEALRALRGAPLRSQVNSV